MENKKKTFLHNHNEIVRIIPLKDYFLVHLLTYFQKIEFQMILRTNSFDAIITNFHSICKLRARKRFIQVYTNFDFSNLKKKH